MGRLLVCENIEGVQSHDDIECVMLWSGLDEDENITSIPKAMDSDFDLVRQQYLDWLSNLGNSVIDGMRLVEHLSVRQGFSMWWMSLLVEKSQWKSRSIFDVFKLLVFDSIMRCSQYSNIDHIEIAVKDRRVRKALVLWCKSNGLKYSTRTRMALENKITFSYLYGLLPYSFQSVVYLVYYIVRSWSVERVPLSQAQASKRQVSFISYFFNSDFEGLKKGEYKSRYWTLLYDLLQGLDYHYNWLHLYVKSNEITSPKIANDLINRLNSKLYDKEVHNLLEMQVGLPSLASVLSDYVKNWAAVFRIRKIKNTGFKVDGTAVTLWPLLAHDWKDSFFGKTAISNVLYLNQFETLINALPKQEKGFYLLENQAWERALIYVWREAGHGPLIGVQHSTVNPCDLRYFFHPSEYSNKQPFALPLPDQIAVNGQASKRQFLYGGVPEDKLVDVEGLRYLYLDGLDKIPKVEKQKDRLKLLVLGDYLPDVTNKQMQMLSDIAGNLPENADVMVKSHPACQIMQADWPALKLNVLDGSLDEFVHYYDVAFTSNVTAAAVDAYLAGKRVISMLDPETFNMSPLRGFSGVEFVSSNKELIDALDRVGAVDRVMSDDGARQFFYTDTTLPRWTKIVSNNATN